MLDGTQSGMLGMQSGYISVSFETMKIPSSRMVTLFLFGCE